MQKINNEFLEEDRKLKESIEQSLLEEEKKENDDDIELN